MIKLIPIFLITLLLWGCAGRNTNLYIDKNERRGYSGYGIGTNYSGVLTPLQRQTVTHYLERNRNPIPVAGKEESVRSYRDYARLFSLPFPNATTCYWVTRGVVAEGMDPKDVWLTKGPPSAVFVADTFVTWRYPDDALVVFIDNKATKIAVSH